MQCGLRFFGTQAQSRPKGRILGGICAFWKVRVGRCWLLRAAGGHQTKRSTGRSIKRKGK
eukprot:9510556-Karenia_brevis.AAC.1